MANNNEVLLKVEHLCQYFGPTKAVDDVSFDIKKGEVFGLVGESGCGKTTTGRSIIGLYDITGGTVTFKGKKISVGTGYYKYAIRTSEAKIKKLKKDKKRAKLSARRDIRDAIKKEYINIDTQKRELKNAIHDKKNIDKKIRTKIQMIFQDPIASLDPRMTVRDIIAEGLIINGMKDKKEIDEKVYKILELVGLVKEHASRYPHEFSGGQKQRIGVARAVIMEPDLIIADEPVSALDVSIQAQVINLLNDLRRDLGLTILFIAHDLSVVKYFSDRIGVMYFGKMVELAPADELFKNPLHPYTRSLLSAIPLPDPMYEKKRQRIVYNPLAAHDYSKEGPKMREITPGHFVYCNSAEFARYQKELKK